MSARLWLLAAALACALPALPAGASTGSPCARIDDPVRRLACHDEESGRAAALRARELVPVSTARQADGPMQASPAASRAPGDGCGPTGIDARWSLDKCMTDTLLEPRFHRPVYLIGRYSDNPNDPGDADSQQLDAWEAKFQLSLKARLWGSDDRRHALWIGYTQQSHWQVGNEAQSRPFRETNYQPELIYAWRPDVQALPDWKLLTLAYLHESNGRSGTESRSWNRVYAQFGFERAFDDDRTLELFVRPWVRVREEAARDDNPDITDFTGYGDVTLLMRQCGHTLGFMARGNPRTRKGAFQATWSTPPLIGALRGYVQFFTGYGESLLDYNWRQTTVGFGVALNDVIDDSPGKRAGC